MSSIVPSVASLGDAAGRAAEQHIIPAFHALITDAPDASEGEGFLSLSTGEPHPFANFALVEDPDTAGVTEAALAQLPLGELPTALIYPRTPLSAEVAQAVEASGHQLAETMPAMAVDIAALPSTELPEGYEFRRVDDSLKDPWREALAAGYEIPPGCAAAMTPDSLGAEPAAADAVQLFAVLRGGTIVCTSLLFLAEGIAGIYCVATLPEERGKGLAAHATAEPLRLVRDAGYGVGVLQSSAAGHSVYLKLGFQDLGEVPLHVRMPG